MDDVLVQCPSCLQQVELAVAPEEEGVLIQDCDVCYRPLEITVRRDDEGQPTVTVRRS